MTIEQEILKNIESFDKYDETTEKYLDDGPAKYDIIIKLLGLQKEYQQKVNELNQLNYNFNQGIPLDQIKKYQRKGILMNIDGSDRTCVNNSGVCSSNKQESQIKFQDFFDPSVRKELDNFGSIKTDNKIIPFYTRDSIECGNMCKDDKNCGMWLYADMDGAINSINKQLEQGSKYNDANRNLVMNTEANTALSKHGGGVLGWLYMIFGNSPIEMDLGTIKKGTQIVRGNCFNIPTDKVGKNITCNQPNSVIGKTMFDLPRINNALDKTFGLNKSVLTPETVKYSSGYCDNTVDMAENQMLAQSQKNFAPIRKKMMKNKNEYKRLRNEKEKELLYLSVQMKSLLDKRSAAMESARMNIEASKHQIEKIGKKQEEIDSNVVSFNNSVREYQQTVVEDESKAEESVSHTFKYTFWLTLFICFAILIFKPELLSKPVSYTLMSIFSAYVLYKIYKPLLGILETIYKTLKKILWSNNNI